MAALEGGLGYNWLLKSAAQRLSSTLIITRPQGPRRMPTHTLADRVNDDVGRALKIAA